MLFGSCAASWLHANVFINGSHLMSVRPLPLFIVVHFQLTITH